MTEETGARTESSGAPAPTSARLTIARSFVFAGRATRTELASYVLFALLLSMALWFAGIFLIPDVWTWLVGNTFTAILAIPVPALLVRRLHDQDRGGHWAWLAVFSFAIWLLRALVSALQGFEARIAMDRFIWPLDWLVIIANLTTIILAVMPGTPGPNRFGPDPRRR